MSAKKIAIIGAGISGLTCGYILAKKHDVVVYEANDYIGGHTRTVHVEKDGEEADIDTGFIVFNDRTYPEFMGLMDTLNVPYQPTEMSFSVRNDALDLEYNGNSLNTLFAQRKNLLRPYFWKMLNEIISFNKEVRRKAQTDQSISIGNFLESTRYSSFFQENYLLPMISAIWSMGIEGCMDFPLQFFVRFFDNHGLLDLVNRPQWYTIKGGSSSYIKPLTDNYKDRIRLNSKVSEVRRTPHAVTVITPEGNVEFDEVIFACHGDQVLQLLAEPTQQEKDIMGKFTCSTNKVILHTDTSFMPRNRLAWASWNYNMVDKAREQTTLTYNMNILQRLKKAHTYMVTLNQEILPAHILGTFNYSHPIYTIESIHAQEQWHVISGLNRTHFCGAYWFNGFHEDGVRSAQRVCTMMEGTQ